MGDELGAALAESWIPVVASGGGAGGSLWRSDVGLLNRSALTNRVKIRIEMPGLAVDRDLELAPGQHLVMDDVVSGVRSQRFGIAAGLRLRTPDHHVADLQRLRRRGPSVSTSVGSPGPGGLCNGDTAVVMHLREDDPARSNIGILNAGRREARVRDRSLRRYGCRGCPGQPDRSIRVRSNSSTDPSSAIGGRTDIEVGYAVVTVLDGEEVVVYGSVVDAGTNDPTTIPMKTGGRRDLGPCRRGGPRRGRGGKRVADRSRSAQSRDRGDRCQRGLPSVERSGISP